MSGRTVEATVSVSREVAAPRMNDEKLMQLIESLVWASQVIASVPGGQAATPYVMKAIGLLNELRGTGTAPAAAPPPPASEPTPPESEATPRPGRPRS